jgi:hypothetical protein
MATTNKTDFVAAVRRVETEWPRSWLTPATKSLSDDQLWTEVGPQKSMGQAFVVLKALLRPTWGPEVRARVAKASKTDELAATKAELEALKASLSDAASKDAHDEASETEAA